MARLKTWHFLLAGVLFWTDFLLCYSAICPPFNPKNITALENATFLAQIGPTGGERGYDALTGECIMTTSYITNGITFCNEW